MDEKIKWAVAKADSLCRFYQHTVYGHQASLQCGSLKQMLLDILSNDITQEEFQEIWNQAMTFIIKGDSINEISH